MTAWEEVRTRGAFGEEATVELYRCVRAVARAGNFPPPEGHPSWTLDAVIETAHDVFADSRGPQRLVELAVKASDDGCLSRSSETIFVIRRGPLPKGDWSADSGSFWKLTPDSPASPETGQAPAISNSRTAPRQESGTAGSATWSPPPTR